MKALPVKANEAGRSVTVADFLEAGGEALSLSVVAGADNLDREIEEPIVNRPGLALTGFYDHFAAGRLQLIGKGEMAYLKSLDPRTRLARIRAIVGLNARCFVYTNGQQPGQGEVSLIENSGGVILSSPLKTRVFAGQSAIVLDRKSVV